MKKILIFSLAYFPDAVGGAEIAIKEITQRIPDIEFHLVTHRFDSSLQETEKIGNVLVHRIGSGSSYLSKVFFIPRAARKALALHKELHFSGAWAMMSYMTFPLTLMRMFGTNIPYVLTLQEGDPFEHVFRRMRIRLVAPVLRYGFRHANVVQTISNFLATWATKAGFRGVVQVIPNGVDVAHFSQAYPETTINGIRDALGKKMGDVFLVTASRLVHKNALDDVIRALPMLPQNVQFIVLGTGSDEGKLKSLALKLGITSRVRFLGQISHRELPEYLKACDIFIRPSRSEGMGNSFVEAMAAGLPVIATQEGGIADFLFDEKRNSDKPVTGWAVAKDSPEQIAQAVKNVIANPEKVRAVARTAAEMVKETYDWNSIARDMQEKVFEPLMRV